MNTKWTWETITVSNCDCVPPFGSAKGTKVIELMPDGKTIVTCDSLAHFQAWEFDADGNLERAVTYTSEYYHRDVQQPTLSQEGVKPVHQPAMGAA